MIESEAYSEHCQTSKVESFAKIVNGFKKVTIFKRNSILEIFDRQDSECAFANIFQLYPKNSFYCSINRNYQSLSAVRNSNNNKLINNIKLVGLKEILVSTHQKIIECYIEVGAILQ